MTKKEEVRKLVRSIKRKRLNDVTELISECFESFNFQPMYDLDCKCIYEGDIAIPIFCGKGNVVEMIPDNLTVNGNLDIRYISRNMKTFPSNLVVNGDLIIGECLRIDKLPSNLVVNGDLLMSKCCHMDGRKARKLVSGKVIRLHF